MIDKWQCVECASDRFNISKDASGESTDGFYCADCGVELEL